METETEILIVDDREENLLALESVLSSADYRLVRASSGVQALRRVLEREFAVILIDVVMPDMDGFELAMIIKQRERSRHTPIIFLTAAGSEISFIYRAYSIGAVDYLMKPIDADVLRAKVAIFVELFRKDRRIQEQGEALRAAERRERERELAAIHTASQQRYRNLAEAIPQIVWTAAPDGMITYFNRRWYEYTGQSAAEAKGWGWMAALEPAAARRWRDRLATGETFELECRLMRHDGGVGWHLCRAVPELGGDRQIVGWLGTCTDCDDLKRACDLAESAVRVRDEFLSIASHELRTPLTTLQLRLKSLRTDLASAGIEARLQRKLDSSLRQGSRLVSLVDGLLDVSRITTGAITLQLESFDLVEVVRELVDQFSEVAEIAGVALRFHGDGATEGVWDRLRIEQIVQNLLSNAIKYAPNHPVDVTVDSRDGTATITVRDHGGGIAPEDRERIFAPFERAASAKSYAGLGLGLYIARETAAIHGGTIRVLTEPSEGATFVVELPQGEAARTGSLGPDI